MPARPVNIDHDFLGSGTATNLRPPAEPSDATTKDYVDAGFQPLDVNLTEIAALVSTEYGRALLTLANAAALLTAAGISAGDSAPVDPAVGQIWLDTSTS